MHSVKGLCFPIRRTRCVEKQVLPVHDDSIAPPNQRASRNASTKRLHIPNLHADAHPTVYIPSTRERAATGPNAIWIQTSISASTCSVETTIFLAFKCEFRNADHIISITRLTIAVDSDDATHIAISDGVEVE